jgi:hypothetical protein
MKTSTMLDRKRVEKFFTRDSKANQRIAASALSIFLGLLAFTQRHGWPVGLFLIGLGACWLAYSRYERQQFGEYYRELKRAKELDFASVLLRSYDAINVDLSKLHRFDIADFDVSVPKLAATGEEGGRLTELAQRSVFLCGRSSADQLGAHAQYWRFVVVDGVVQFEHSPIELSLLYLTSQELLLYQAHIDIVNGDILREDTNRIFLHDIVQTRSTSTTERLSRKDNLALFVSYDRAAKARSGETLVVSSHWLEVTRTDGRAIRLPVSAPTYRVGATGVLDGKRGGDQVSIVNRRTSEIIGRINDAKAAAVQGGRPSPHGSPFEGGWRDP